MQSNTNTTLDNSPAPASILPSNSDLSRVPPAEVSVVTNDISDSAAAPDSDSCIQAASVAAEAAFNTLGANLAKIVAEAEKTLQNSSCKSSKPDQDVLHALAVVASKRDPKDRLTDIRQSSVVTKKFLADVIYDRKRDRLSFAVWDNQLAR